MSDALSQLNALLAAAAAAQQQHQLMLQLQQQQQHQQQSQSAQQPNPLFQQLQQMNQSSMTSSASFPPPNLPALTEQALQSLLFAQSLQQKQLQQQHQENKPLIQSTPVTGQQSILNSINSDHAPKLNSSMSLDALPLPLLSQIPSNLNSELYSNTNQINNKNFQNIDDNLNQLDLMNEFNKINLNDSKNNTTNNTTNNNTSSNFDNSLLSINDSEIYSADQNYMPGTASLIEDVDKLLMVVLRDGKTLIGYLRSIDQYANLLLSSTIERIHVGNKYGDIPRGIYIVRGENVVLIGEVDFKIQPKVEMIKVDVNEILELQKIEQKKLEAEKLKKKALSERCLLSQTDAVLDEYY